MNKEKVPLSYKICKRIIQTSVVALAVLVIGTMVPFSKLEERYRTTKFEVVTTETDMLELGERETRQEGVEGKIKETMRVEYRLFSNWLYGIVTKRTTVESEVVREPVDKEVVVGTKRYQYMLCSDGSSRYYTDADFKNKNIGFTSKSADFCAENGQGRKVGLSEVDPNEEYYVPSSGGAICRDGSRSYSTGSGTCSWHGGVARWL
jgi:hypothetical protein